MKYIDEYRDPGIAQGSRRRDPRSARRRHWVLMEICGGQTHTLMRYGIDELSARGSRAGTRPRLPGLRHAARNHRSKPSKSPRAPTSPSSRYGDMLRVPGSQSDLFRVQALPAATSASSTRRWKRCKIARQNPQRQVVFFGIGFETTAPPTPWRSGRRKREGLRNFSMLMSHVLVPPAIRLLLGSSRNRVQGFIAPGHVCTVMGFRRIRRAGTRFPRPHRGRWIRASGPAGSHQHARRAARRRPH